MISIRSELEHLERCLQARDLALNSYVLGIKNLAEYAIDLDPEVSTGYRKYLQTLAEHVASGEAPILLESQADLRGLLRDYRDKATQYLKGLRSELSETARSLEEILGTLAQSDGDHQSRVRAAISRLRTVAGRPAGVDLCKEVANAADSIEQVIEDMRKQHQLTISQFQQEIRVLHKRIDTLEASASRDKAPPIYNRHEIEHRIRSAPSNSCLLLIKVNGFRLAEVNFRADVAAELAGAFVRRLQNALPDPAMIGRWSLEEFAAILPISRAEATNAAKWIGENLSGAYSCLLSGKTVRPTLQITVAVLDVQEQGPDELIKRVKAFLPVG